MNAAAADRRCSHIPARRWAGWAVACAFYFFDVFARLTVDVVTSTLQKEFGVGAAVVSTSFSSSFFYAYAAMQLPIGWLLDVLGPRRTLALCSLLSAGGMVGFGLSHSVLAGTVCRVLTGVGCGGGWLTTIKVCRTNFGLGGKLSDSMVGVSNMIGGIGGLASQGPMSALVGAVGWRYAFIIGAAFPAVLFFLALVFVVDTPIWEDEQDEQGDADASARKLLAAADGSVSSGSGEGYSPQAVALSDPLLQQQQQQGGEDAGAAGAGAAGAAAASGGRSGDTITTTATAPSPNAAQPTRFRTIVTSGRMWLLAGYLAGTDSPFECFAGLWGVACLTEGQGWKAPSPATATTALALTATVCQFLGGPVSSIWASFRGRMAWLTGLALCGLVSIGPFLSGSPALPVALVGTAIGLQGISVGSATVVWAAISSDPLCDGVGSSGLVSGAVNTFCIACDALVQTLVGVVLDVYWEGKFNAKGERVYSSVAFGRAFIILAVAFFCGAACSAAAWIKDLPKPAGAESEEDGGGGADDDGGSKNGRDAAKKSGASRGEYVAPAPGQV